MLSSAHALPDNDRSPGGRYSLNHLRSVPAVRQFVRNRIAIASLGFFVLLIIVAGAAPLFAPYQPEKLAITERLTSPSRGRLLGTEQFGRDVRSRLVFGDRLTFFSAFIAVGLAAILGVALGALAGYARGWVGAVIIRSMDILLLFRACCGRLWSCRASVRVSSTRKSQSASH